MCELCEMSRCPSACPSYGEYDADHGRCALCEGRLTRGERVLEQNGRFLCAECAAGLDLDGLLYLCGVTDAAELLRELSWEDRPYF